MVTVNNDCSCLTAEECTCADECTCESCGCEECEGGIIGCACGGNCACGEDSMEDEEDSPEDNDSN